MMVREILEWTQDKIYELDVNDKFSYIKAFGLGAIEGAIDGAVLMYPIVLIGLFVANKKLNEG